MDPQIEVTPAPRTPEIEATLVPRTPPDREGPPGGHPR